MRKTIDSTESMSGNIIQLNEQFIHNELKTIVKNSVEETLNALLDAEADKLVQAERYARDQARKVVLEYK